MIFQPRKAALYKLAIDHGIQRPEELLAHLPLGSSVPQPRLEGWLNQLLRLPKTFSEPRRYVNRFKIGADPEFLFAITRYDAQGAQIDSGRVDASSIGFAQGPAFGADNNGRLAEIRPYPSRSALEVVASILCTFRWMALQFPQVLKYEWLSGAYLWDDGLGGHVHFGRKRPTRKTEIEALDAVEEALLHLGAYPREQVLRRRQGDARRQIYGALGDFRFQQHGYEYRTFPSWLDSPGLAFLTLVVAKLAVQMPSLYRFKGGNPAIEQARLRNFLAYFKGCDDDARLCLLLLDRGIPQQQKGSFAARWGVTSTGRKHPSNIPIIPPCIKPDAASVQEIFDHLRDGKPLEFRTPAITWSPVTPPADYMMCLLFANTIQAVGLGEMIWDICCHAAQPITFTNARAGGHPILLSRDLQKCIPKSMRKVIPTSDLRAGTICTTPEYRRGARGLLLRKLLLGGTFPLWRAKDCKPESYKLWQEQMKDTSPKPTLAGSVIYESTDHRVGPLAPA